MDTDRDLAGNPSRYNAINVPRGDGSDYDIGAYEYQGPFILSSDFSDSGLMDPLDLYLFGTGWGVDTGPALALDLTPDGMVDAIDLEIFLRDWWHVSGP